MLGSGLIVCPAFWVSIPIPVLPFQSSHLQGTLSLCSTPHIHFPCSFRHLSCLLPFLVMKENMYNCHPTGFVCSALRPRLPTHQQSHTPSFIKLLSPLHYLLHASKQKTWHFSTLAKWYGSCVRAEKFHSWPNFTYQQTLMIN